MISNTDGRRLAISDGVRMMPEPIVPPSDTAIPKVTPRIRSMLRLAGAELVVAAVNYVSPFRSAEIQLLALQAGNCAMEDNKESARTRPPLRYSRDAGYNVETSSELAAACKT
jgi:hypothetical protein